MPNNFWIYILKCNGSYYTGHTDNLEQRIAQHTTRTFTNSYTGSCLPVTTVFTQPCNTREEALICERKIKGWSRKKKAAMIDGDWNAVSS